MSRRPNKKLNRLRRALNKTGSTVTYIDLIDWLKTRRHAQTSVEAEKMLLDGRVKANANVVGRTWDPGLQRWALDPYCSSALRSDLRVSAE